MAPPLILPLSQCTDPTLVGGKAVGLSRLLATGFSVPDGICVTTEAYHQALAAAGFRSSERWQRAFEQVPDARRNLLLECQRIIRQADISPLVETCNTELGRMFGMSANRWAIRSSATNEDTSRASFAGLYKTELGVSPVEFGHAIKELWASLWEERVLAYMLSSKAGESPPAMAVVIQPTLDVAVAGVAYSIHPVTGRMNQVVINAVRGLAVPLVEGAIEPDHYVIEQGTPVNPGRILKRTLSRQSERLTMGSEGLCKEPVSVLEQTQFSLSDPQLLEVSLTAKRIERAFHHPVDLEWAIEGERLWILQARPTTAVRPTSDLTNDDCEWSRANFKETMPDVPSPMGLSFLEYFMEAYIIAHYRRLGCRIPQGLSSVRILHGRPYLNVTLFHSVVGQLGGDTALLAEQLGGESLAVPPEVRRLGWFALARAAITVYREMRRAERDGPRCFEEMKRFAVTYRPEIIQQWSEEQIAGHLDRIGKWLDSHEITFGIAAAVGQCLQAFSGFMPRWIGSDWRTLLNAALQGQGTVISAQQIMRLAELVEIARMDSIVSEALCREGAEPGSYRLKLQGTRFLSEFDRYLTDYGHRGLGESDVMSPRFADQPEILLAVIAVQLGGASSTLADVAGRQRAIRAEALRKIRSRCGWRIDRWAIFHWWFRRLCRFSALREANRHHLMYYSAAVRHLLLLLGERLMEQGILKARDDLFFLTLRERLELSSGISKDWAALAQARRADRDQWLAVQVPDTVRDWEEVTKGNPEAVSYVSSGVWQGIPISPGSVSGPARIVRSLDDWGKVVKGDILVVPVIDPGMAPLFGIAAGLVAEMGGTLSHGAIIAREYGLPAVANVANVTEKLKDDDQIRLDAGAGQVRAENSAEQP